MSLSEILNNLEIETEITAEEKRASIKKHLSSWADSIPHHGIANFGEQIELLTAKSIPSYSAGWVVQYETRSIHQGVRPYQGTSIFPKHIQLNNESEIWKVNLPLAENFAEGAREYGIAEKVQVCGDCRGQGRISCPSCRGTHKIACSNCNGNGRVQCDRCRGSGSTRIYANNGIGYHEEACPSCGGQRFVFCSSCAGSGAKECTHCVDGTVTCHTCSGAGQLVNFIYLKDDFLSVDDIEFAHHNLLPKEAYTKVVAEEKNTERICEILEKEINPDIFNLTNHEGLKQLCTTILIRLSNNPALSDNKKHSRIAREKMVISKINVVNIEYRFSGKTYNAWLYGEGNIFAQTSPVSEICEGLYNNAQEEFKNKEYSKALDLMEKVVVMFDKAEYRKFKEKIEKIVHSDYLKGAIIGGTICPVIGNILGIIIGLILKNSFSTKIRSFKKRFMHAFWVSFIINGFLFAVLLAVILFI